MFFATLRKCVPRMCIVPFLSFPAFYTHLPHRDQHGHQRDQSHRIFRHLSRRHPRPGEHPPTAGPSPAAPSSLPTDPPPKTKEASGRQSVMEQYTPKPVDTFVYSGLTGGLLGFLYGGMSAAQQSTLAGQRGLTRLRRVGANAAVTAGSLGLLFGSFRGVQAMCEQSRGKHDAYNASMAGAVTGVLAAASTRRPSVILTAGLLTGSVTGLIYMFSPHPDDLSLMKV